MKCPVCYATDIHELVTVCPHCRADLTAFAAVESAEEESPEDDPEEDPLELYEYHDEECPVCLEEIPPEWITARQDAEYQFYVCCGRVVCAKCADEAKTDLLMNCPFCRSEKAFHGRNPVIDQSVCLLVKSTKSDTKNHH